MITVLRVEEVDVGSQADLAGIQAGDYLLDYNGVALYRTEQLAKLCSSTEELVNSVELLRGEQCRVCRLSPGGLGLTIMVSQISDRVYRQAKPSLELPDHIPSAVLAARQQLQQIRRVLLSTTENVPPYRITEFYEPVSYLAHCSPAEVLPANASLTEQLSQSYTSSTHADQQLQQLCCQQLQQQANQLGANAVINLRFELNSNNGSMLLMATGTAVRVERQA